MEIVTPKITKFVKFFMNKLPLIILQKEFKN